MYKLLNFCLWQHQKWSNEESHENDRRLHLMPRDHKPLKYLRRYAIRDVRFIVWEARPRLSFDTHAQYSMYIHMYIDPGNGTIHNWTA